MFDCSFKRQLCQMIKRTTESNKAMYSYWELRHGLSFNNLESFLLELWCIPRVLYSILFYSRTSFKFGGQSYGPGTQHSASGKGKKIKKSHSFVKDANIQWTHDYCWIGNRGLRWPHAEVLRLWSIIWANKGICRQGGKGFI